MDAKIYVLGAGIVGICCAITLQRDGHKVVLLDKTGPAAGASFGNAGAIVNGSCVPTSTPGIIGNALKMLKPGGPLSISPTYLPKLLPWLIRFTLQSSEKNYQRNALHLVALTKHATNSWQKLLKNTDSADMFKAVGWLRLFETSQAFNANASSRQLMTDLGTPYQTLSFDEIYDLEPNLARIFQHGFYQPDCHFISNPQRMLQSLTEHFVANGGQFKVAEVTDIKVKELQPMIETTIELIYPDKVVVTAGAWSTKLTKGINYSAPLETERGYHMMLPVTNAISRPIVSAEQAFVLSPMETGLRVTSQVELAAVDAPANYAKIRALLPKVKRMLPEAEMTEQSCWMGCRPSLPDSLPIISQGEDKNIFFAFGHQHLGMTLGPITGELIADLVAGRTSAIDLSPYRADRF